MANNPFGAQYWNALCSYEASEYDQTQALSFGLETGVRVKWSATAGAVGSLILNRERRVLDQSRPVPSSFAGPIPIVSKWSLDNG